GPGAGERILVGGGERQGDAHAPVGDGLHGRRGDEWRARRGLAHGPRERPETRVELPRRGHEGAPLPRHEARRPRPAEVVDAVGAGGTRDPGGEERERERGGAAAHETAPASLAAAISSHEGPSASSTSSVCCPASGAGRSAGAVSSNWTGLATSVKRVPSPRSTSGR